MNPFERQMQLGRELMELNAQWFQKIAEFDTANFQKYVEYNQEMASRLPEVRDVQSFTELQREYGETLWNGAQEAMQARSDMLREATTAAGEVVKGAFTVEEEAPAPKKTAAKKAAA